MKKIFFIICLSLLFINASADSIHYFDLSNRTANDVIPILKPLLNSGESISGDGYLLFMNTTTARAKEIQSLIDRIDQQIKTLRIYVTSDEHLAISENEISISGRASSGDASVSVGNPPRKTDGITIRGNYQTLDNERLNTHFINVQEGSPAFVSRERIRLIPVTSFIRRGVGVSAIDHTLPISSEDGFYVIARTSNGRYANIKLQSAISSDDSQSIYNQETQSIETQLRVPLGIWNEIGGVTESSQSSSSGIINRTKSRQERNNKIFLKIELAN